jgi:hypothetical protein
LLLTVRQRAGDAVAHRRQPDGVENAVDAARLFFGLPPEQSLARAPVALQREADIVLDRVHIEDGRLLELAADPKERDLGFVEAREIVGTVEVDLARVRPGFAGDHIHHCGFAGAVGTDDGTHLSGLDGEGEIVERAKAVERHRHAVEVEEGRRRARVHAHSAGRAAACAMFPFSSAAPARSFRCHSPHRSRSVPTMPRGSSKVTATNNPPSRNSQYGASIPLVKYVLP